MQRANLCDYLLRLAANADEVDVFRSDPDSARAAMAAAGLSEGAQSALLSGSFLALNTAIATELTTMARAGRSIPGLTLTDNMNSSLQVQVEAQVQVEVAVETQTAVHVETHVEAHVETHVQVHHETDLVSPNSDSL